MVFRGFDLLIISREGSFLPYQSQVDNEKDNERISILT